MALSKIPKLPVSKKLISANLAKKIIESHAGIFKKLKCLQLLA